MSDKALTNPAPIGIERNRRRHRRSLGHRLRSFFKKIKWRYLVILLVAVIALIVVGSAALITDANVRVQDSYADLKRVVATIASSNLSDLKPDDLDRLNAALGKLTDSLNTAQNQIGIFSFLRPFRKDIGATIDTLAIANEVSTGASDMLNGIQPTAFFLMQQNSTPAPGNFDSGIGARVVELLQVGQGSLLDANVQFTTAENRLKTLQLQNVPSSLLLTVQELITYEGQLSSANKILMTAPDLLTKAMGLDTSQNYLILSANSDELRPSGGYLSTYGWVTLRRLRITNFDYQPTTDTSPSPPPASMVSTLSIPDWWIKRTAPIYTAWDGSWYADFPSTAKMAAWFYDNGQNVQAPVDGVLSIDIYGFEDILKGLGSVTVPGYSQPVTADNFRQVIYQIRDSGASDLPHKQFLAAFYKELFREWQNIAPDKSSAVVIGVLQALREKHIMLYFKDSQMNAVIDLLGWSGKQDTAVGHDYLMVADTNLGSKSNRSVVRQLTYDAQINDDNTVTGRASIEYDFPASLAQNDPGFNPKNYTNINYYNIMQVYTPVGTTITDTHNLQSKLNTDATATYTDFSTLTEVDYDGTERFQLSYKTPSVVQSFGTYWQYRLLLQKQPGTNADAASVQVTLPKGTTVVSTSPDAVATYNLGQPVLEFNAQLLTDQWIKIVYSK